METIAERRDRIGKEKLRYIRQENEKREAGRKVRAERQRRISLIPTRYDLEERWAKGVLKQQARARGIISVPTTGGKKRYVTELKKKEIVKRILKHDNDPHNLDTLKAEAEKRGITGVAKAKNRELLVKLRLHDHGIPLQPELVDISYHSASEATSEAEEDSDDSEDEPVQSREPGKRVTFREGTEGNKRQRRK
eukprot:Hpha_TRINITY_DN15857_c3_g3::TRINITY_DN15857_c3_g3_i5::g.190628::m.190628